VARTLWTSSMELNGMKFEYRVSSFE